MAKLSISNIDINKQNTLLKTDDYVVTTSDLGKTLIMNSGSSKTFTLPSVGSSEDGYRITFINRGSGRMTLQASNSDIIDDSSAGGTIYTETVNASITIEYSHDAVTFFVINSKGTFTTT